MSSRCKGKEIEQIQAQFCLLSLRLWKGSQVVECCWETERGGRVDGCCCMIKDIDACVRGCARLCLRTSISDDAIIRSLLYCIWASHHRIVAARRTASCRRAETRHGVGRKQWGASLYSFSPYTYIVIVINSSRWARLDSSPELSVTE